MMNMNGETSPIPNINLVNKDLVAILEKTLEAAKAGQIDSVVVVASGRGGLFPPVINGVNPILLHLGCCMATQALLQTIANPQNLSSIVRPPAGLSFGA